MGHFTRPKATVLPDSAVVPEQNLISPPAALTHELVADQPYYYADPVVADKPDGTFPAGTKVALVARGGGAMCRVATAQGLSVTTAFAGLYPLQRPAQRDGG